MAEKLYGYIADNCNANSFFIACSPVIYDNNDNYYQILITNGEKKKIQKWELDYVTKIPKSMSDDYEGNTLVFFTGKNSDYKIDTSWHTSNNIGYIKLI